MIYMKRILFFAWLVLVSCSSEEIVEPPLAQHTLLVYLAGDNNLSAEVRVKTDSLLAGWSDQANNLLIYQDVKDEERTPVLLKAIASDTGAYAVPVKTYPEHDSASPEVFAEVFDDAFSQFPAHSYGLLLFSHGTGWLTDNDRLTRTIVQDGTSSMPIPDFAAVIPDGKLEYIVFEACLMSGVEVAYELRRKTKYIVASSTEILSPGFLPVYGTHLADLFTCPAGREAGLVRFARAFFETADAETGLNRSATISVIATAGLDKLAALTAPVLQDGSSVDLNAVQQFNSYPTRLYFDFADYISRAASAEQYAAISAQLNETVRYRAATPAFTYFAPLSSRPVRTSCGLTLYVPQAQYPELNRAYKMYEWVKNTVGE